MNFGTMTGFYDKRTEILVERKKTMNSIRSREQSNSQGKKSNKKSVFHSSQKLKIFAHLENFDDYIISITVHFRNSKSQLNVEIRERD